jgi:hypothetical protein
MNSAGRYRLSGQLAGVGEADVKGHVLALGAGVVIGSIVGSGVVGVGVTGAGDTGAGIIGPCLEGVCDPILTGLF